MKVDTRRWVRAKDSLRKKTEAKSFKRESLPWTRLIILPGTCSIGTKYLSTKFEDFSMISPSLIDGCQCSFIMSSKFACCKSNNDIYPLAASFNYILIFGGPNGKRVPLDMSTDTVTRFLTCTTTNLLAMSY